MDFAENLSILMAVLVQSEHWVTRSSTVFVMVFSHLCRFEWDKSTGALPVGAEVTVEGEMAGEADPETHVAVEGAGARSYTWAEVRQRGSW